MKFLSLFSGIDAASVAWNPIGWECIGFSEIEKFPSAVLAHRFPGVKNYGDITKANYGSIKPDIIVGGSPCQSFSVAGLRKGMDDPRGNLALAYLARVAELRPRWVVWENVPGVLSSNGGRDFAAFAFALAGIGYGFCWRILDAQFHGVPQQRRRVFLVGYSGDWRPPAAVLFESESLRWDTQKSGEKGKDITRTITSGFGRGGDLGEAAGDLCPVVVMAHGQAGAEIKTGMAPALTCDHEAPIVFEPRHFTRGQAGGKPKEKANALSANSYGSSDAAQHVLSKSRVRRLTPMECERLMGFPGDWTRIPWRGKKAEDCPDGPRYKAIGNSMAVPVMRWIGNRIAMFEGMAAK